MGQAKTVLLGCALSLSACVGQVDSADVAAEEGDVQLAGDVAALCGRDAPSYDIEARRSLAVTEQPILARFSFERVMKQLVSQARVPGLTATKLFQQWWDTQSPSAEGVYDGPHCDSHTDDALGSVLNGFPYSCRPAPSEAAQVACDPFKDEACKYIPIGLFNRFDLAPSNGATCGEYRIVFAKATGQTDTRDRNLVIFEAAMPNPEPHKGLEGCRAIVSFWAELSQVNKLEERARRLEQFYFYGLGRRIPAVVDIRHFGDNAQGRGQVRTNQFMQRTTSVWSLREFKLDRACQHENEGEYEHEAYSRGGYERCTLRFNPVTNKVNPYGPLFAQTGTHSKTAAFQQSFLEQVDSLAADNLTDIALDVPNTFNSAQSQASQSTETNYLANFEDGGSFADGIMDRLENLGSDLEPVDVVARAQTQSCAGCHRLSNGAELGGGLKWPSSLGFTHVAESAPETVDGVVRFRISEALTSTFLPHRKEVMQEFLRGRRGRRGYALAGARHSH